MAHIDPSTLRAFLSDAVEALDQHRPVTRWDTWRSRLGASVTLGVLLVGCGGQSESEDVPDGGTGGVETAGVGGGLPGGTGGAVPGETGGDTGAGGTLYGIPFTGGTGSTSAGGTGGASSGGTGGVPAGGTGGLQTGGVAGEPAAGTGGALVGGTGGVETGGTGGYGTGGYGIGGEVYGIPFEDCTNGYDDDWDGAVDCDDSDCLGVCGTPDYAVPFEAQCDNGLDDDYDNLTDCDDPDCSCQGAGGAGGDGGMAGVGGTGGWIPNGTGGAYAIPL